MATRNPKCPPLGGGQTQTMQTVFYFQRKQGENLILLNLVKLEVGLDVFREKPTLAFSDQKHRHDFGRNVEINIRLIFNRYHYLIRSEIAVDVFDET